MKSSNRAERRADAARRRLVLKRSESMTRLAYSLAWQAYTGAMSRNAARRALRAEAVRRYGNEQARLMDPRLPAVGDLT